MDSLNIFYPSSPRARLISLLRVGPFHFRESWRKFARQLPLNAGVGGIIWPSHCHKEGLGIPAMGNQWWGTWHGWFGESKLTICECSTSILEIGLVSFLKKPKVKNLYLWGPLSFLPLLNPQSISVRIFSSSAIIRYFFSLNLDGRNNGIMHSFTRLQVMPESP